MHSTGSSMSICGKLELSGIKPDTIRGYAVFVSKVGRTSSLMRRVLTRTGCPAPSGTEITTG